DRRRESPHRTVTSCELKVHKYTFTQIFSAQSRIEVSNLRQSNPANNHHVTINFDAGCLLLPFHAENDAEARFTAHHPFVSLGGLVQRKHFVHRMHAARRAEAQRVW